MSWIYVAYRMHALAFTQLPQIENNHVGIQVLRVVLSVESSDGDTDKNPTDHFIEADLISSSPIDLSFMRPLVSGNNSQRHGPAILSSEST